MKKKRKYSIYILDYKIMHRFRVWMDNKRFASNSLLTTEYAADLTKFMTLKENKESCLESGMMWFVLVQYVLIMYLLIWL